MGRSEKKVDWKLVDTLLISGCNGTEIAAHFNMHHDTFYRKIEEEYKTSFTAYSQIKRQEGDSLLRHAQFQKAVQGKDNTMLIWLGKNRLKQSENPDTVVNEDYRALFEAFMSQLGASQSERKIESISQSEEHKS